MAVTGVDEVIRQMYEGVERIHGEAVVGIGTRFQPPVNQGTLLQSQDISIQVNPPLFSATIVYPPDYASYTDTGRGPIEARPGGALRFIIGGEVIYAKRVGPAPGTNWFSDVANQESWDAELERAEASASF